MLSMVDATTGPVRYARAGLLGVGVGLVSVLGHSLGHGDVPLVAVLQVLCLAVAGAAALTARQTRPWGLVAYVGGFQLAAHWLLAKMSPHSTGGPLPPAEPVHLHNANGFPPPLEPFSAHSPIAAGVQIDWAMLAGHLIAGLVIVALMWRADEALFSLAAALRRAAEFLLGSALRTTPLLIRTGWKPLSRRTANWPRSRFLCWLAFWRYRGPPTLSVSRG
jgi:hypothetical protein